MRAFQSALRNGQDAERRWVEELRHQGLAIGHGKKIVCRTHCKNTDHVETPDAVALFSVEIKERSLSFTCPDDYPYDTVFVDDLRGLGLETYKHLIYVYISKPTGKWVWLTMLDRCAEWTEEVTHDRGRGHAVPVLVCPKRFLRSSDQLCGLIFPQLYLDLVDGNTELLCGGGGEVEERDRYVAKTNPRAGEGDSPPPGKGSKRVG